MPIALDSFCRTSGRTHLLSNFAYVFPVVFSGSWVTRRGMRTKAGAPLESRFSPRVADSLNAGAA